MDAILQIFVRWVHLTAVIVLVGGLCYARFAAGDLSARFRTLAYTAIGAILISGIYNFLSKPAYPPHYQAWFGIKVLLSLHVFAVTVLYRGKLRSLTGAVIGSGIIVAIAGYLRWISLP
jgi:uncharacterized membrane protein